MYGSNSHLRVCQLAKLMDLMMEEGKVAGIINGLCKDDKEKVRSNYMFIDYWIALSTLRYYSAKTKCSLTSLGEVEGIQVMVGWSLGTSEGDKLGR